MSHTAAKNMHKEVLGDGSRKIQLLGGDQWWSVIPGSKIKGSQSYLVIGSDVFQQYIPVVEAIFQLASVARQTIGQASRVAVNQTIAATMSCISEQLYVRNFTQH